MLVSPWLAVQNGSRAGKMGTAQHPVVQPAQLLCGRHVQRPLLQLQWWVRLTDNMQHAQGIKRRKHGLSAVHAQAPNPMCSRELTHANARMEGSMQLTYAAPCSHPCPTALHPHPPPGAPCGTQN